jgi:hypothetical protein
MICDSIYGITFCRFFHLNSFILVFVFIHRNIIFVDFDQGTHCFDGAWLKCSPTHSVLGPR